MSDNIFQRFQYISLTKKLLSLIALTVLLFAVTRFLKPAQEKVQTITVKRGTITEKVIETGNVQSNDIEVYSPKEGSIIEIYVKNGDKVEKDDDLFKIEETGTEDEEIIEAPADGIISNIALEEGSQVVSNNMDASDAVPVLLIEKDTYKVVKISLGEGDINKVKVGQRAQISISAVKDKEFKGKVIRIDNSGTETSGVITYNVYIRLQSTNTAVKPLMSVTASIETERHKDALLVPFSAVKPYKGGKGVQILETNRSFKVIRPLEVKTGIKSSSEIEITGVLSEGQKVLINTTGNISANTKKISREGLLKRIWVNHMGGKGTKSVEERPNHE